jgi:hypothetical protein
MEIGASAGLNLNVDRFRYADAYGPPESPCRLPDPGLPAGIALRIEERAGCDLHPLDINTTEGRLRLTASIWGDQIERAARLRAALTVAGQHRVKLDQAGAAIWLDRQLAECDHAALVTVVWHSVVRPYVDPAEWMDIERLTASPGIWRLSLEPEIGMDKAIPLRLYGPGIEPEGVMLAHCNPHGFPLTLV